MIYYNERHETIDPQHEMGCLSLSCAGKFIAFIEILFYLFTFLTLKNFLSVEQALILTMVLTLLSIMALALFVGTSVSDRVYIMPWIWTKYAVIFIQIIRFTTLVFDLAMTQKNPAGASPVFELLFLGYNVFALSIILELIEEIEPYTFKRFEYLRV
ncbi:hypothetical protein PVAND_010370 [Polypedilum vanderplanki]|uniref:Uncharacterized protein n=1 Tax=Polypedilum vanderplanki TaxID=319348 RepID=A0A9J6CGH7_POLVA|nr:hypothetical protein PVAND_010370 [Polypedilum vanderplanki]